MNMMNDKADPYCKVRLKKFDGAASSKDSTPYVSGETNPVWTTDNTFEYSFLAELVDLNDGTGELVPLTWDRFSMSEQFLANARFLATTVALGGTDCRDLESK